MCAYPQPGSSSILLYRVALLVFVLTVGIGMLNGLNLVEFERAELLTHVHAGTLGWITLGVLATCAQMFRGPRDQAQEGEPPRWVVLLAVTTVPLYVATFWAGVNELRAALSVPPLVALAGFYAWLWFRRRALAPTLPRLAAFLALTTLLIGSTIGALLQLENAIGEKILTEDAVGGHVAAQTVGYLVLMAMAISEWGLAPESKRISRSGLAQVLMPFVGGLLVSAGALLGSEALLGIFVPLEIAAIIIYLRRMAPALRQVRWLQAEPARHFGVMVPFLVADLALLIVLIVGVVSGTWEDFDTIPVWLVFGYDHAIFVGVMTNGLFGAIQVLTRSRRNVLGFADHALFWGMNLAMLGFVASLLANARELEAFFTPVMGTSIVLAIVACSLRLALVAREPMAKTSVPAGVTLE